ncbi:MAG: hypothetical protein N2748_03075 [candidate division WOR-3 bacterium]|nr:hypothetical protein [candidate division WOR-3 bacterium]
MKKIIILILTVISLSFGQYGFRSFDPWRLWGISLLGFVYLVLAFFLFSLIFWSCYVWIAKDKNKKEESKSEPKSN